MQKVLRKVHVDERPGAQQTQMKMDGKVERNEAQMQAVFQRWRDLHGAQVQHVRRTDTELND